MMSAPPNLQTTSISQLVQSGHILATHDSGSRDSDAISSEERNYHLKLLINIIVLPFMIVVYLFLCNSEYDAEGNSQRLIAPASHPILDPVYELRR